MDGKQIATNDKVVFIETSLYSYKSKLDDGGCREVLSHQFFLKSFRRSNFKKLLRCMIKNKKNREKSSKENLIKKFALLIKKLFEISRGTFLLSLIVKKSFKIFQEQKQEL